MTDATDYAIELLRQSQREFNMRVEAIIAILEDPPTEAKPAAVSPTAEIDAWNYGNLRSAIPEPEERHCRYPKCTCRFPGDVTHDPMLDPGWGLILLTLIVTVLVLVIILQSHRT